MIADSTLSFGMLTARAFCIARRSAGLVPGSGPPFLTAMVMSLPMRLNCFAMRFQRANIVCFLTSNMRPMVALLALARAGWGGRAIYLSGRHIARWERRSREA